MGEFFIYIYINLRQLTIEFNITRSFNLIFICIFFRRWNISLGSFNDCLSAIHANFSRINILIFISFIDFCFLLSHNAGAGIQWKRSSRPVALMNYIFASLPINWQNWHLKWNVHLSMAFRTCYAINLINKKILEANYGDVDKLLCKKINPIVARLSATWMQTRNLFLLLHEIVIRNNYFAWDEELLLGNVQDCNTILPALSYGFNEIREKETQEEKSGNSEKTLWALLSWKLNRSCWNINGKLAV